MFCTKNKTVELECIEEDIELEMILRTINFFYRTRTDISEVPNSLQ